MPSRAPARLPTSAPIVTDLEQLRRSIAADILGQLAGIGINVNIPAIKIPAPQLDVHVAPAVIHVDGAEVEFAPQILPAIVDLTLDISPLARALEAQNAKLDQIIALLAAPVTRTVQRNTLGEITSMTEQRG